MPVVLVESEVHEFDTHTFRVTVQNDGVVKDISAAGIKRIRFTKPDCVTILTVTAEFFDAVNGIVTYTASATDLTPAGLWKGHVYLEFPGPLSFHTSAFHFNVAAI